MARREIVVDYNYFPDPRIIAGRPSVVSAILNEKVPSKDLFQFTDKSRISKRITPATIINREPVIIAHDDPHIEDAENGRRKWISDILSVKPVPKSWTTSDPTLIRRARESRILL